MSGTWRDGKSGQEVTITPEQVRALVSRYNEEYPDHKAFASLGHPTAPGAPSYGWVKGARWIDRKDRKGNPVTVALAEWDSFQPEFFEAVKKGLYRERSSGIRDGRLHHVAWLGAELPAVKGLAPVSFSEAGGSVIEITIDRDADFAEEQAVEDPPADDQSHEDIDMPLTPEDITGVATAVAEAMKPILDAITAKLNELSGSEEEEGGGDAELSEGAATAVTERITQLESDNKLLKEKIRESEFSEFLASDPIKKRIEPGRRPVYLAMMKRADATPGEFEFSELGADGTATQKKGSALDQLKADLLALPELNLSEIATHGRAGDLGANKHVENGNGIAKASQRNKRSA